ncbi:hypothetical protein BHE74_00033640 [Ensete ventricosum]|nr:hypothetical protein BHE74_00033640 [Ensete ventricosum]
MSSSGGACATSQEWLANRATGTFGFPDVSFGCGAPLFLIVGSLFFNRQRLGPPLLGLLPRVRLLGFKCSRRVLAPLSLPSGGGFIHTKWVVDRTLSFTFDDTSGMVDSYGWLSSVRLERSIAIHPDGVAQRHGAPSLMNASQRSFGYHGG